jgi:hypothetical protein
MTARDARRIIAAEMKYTRLTAGETWTDHETNTAIAKDLNITLILDKIQGYKRNWIQNVNRMPRNRLFRLIKKLHLKTRRNHGRDFWMSETETGQQVAQLLDRYMMIIYYT